MNDVWQSEKKRRMFGIMLVIIMLLIISLMNDIFAEISQISSVIVNVSADTNWVSYNVTHLNDSSTEKNLTFDSAGSQLVYITIPKNANVTSAEWNLTGYPSLVTELLKDEEDSYSYTGAWGSDTCTSDPLNGSIQSAVDENWDTFACSYTTDTEKTVELYQNYTVSKTENLRLIFKYALDTRSVGSVVNVSYYIFNFSSNSWELIYTNEASDGAFVSQTKEFVVYDDYISNGSVSYTHLTLPTKA